MRRLEMVEVYNGSLPEEVQNAVQMGQGTSE